MSSLHTSCHVKALDDASDGLVLLHGRDLLNEPLPLLELPLQPTHLRHQAVAFLGQGLLLHVSLGIFKQCVKLRGSGSAILIFSHIFLFAPELLYHSPQLLGLLFQSGHLLLLLLILLLLQLLYRSCCRVSRELRVSHGRGGAPLPSVLLPAAPHPSLGRLILAAEDVKGGLASADLGNDENDVGISLYKDMGKFD